MDTTLRKKLHKALIKDSGTVETSSNYQDDCLKQYLQGTFSSTVYVVGVK